MLEKNIALPEAEAALTDALAALEFEPFAKTQREMASRAKRPEPTEDALRARYGISKAAGLEVAARLHKAMGDLDRALLEFRGTRAQSVPRSRRSSWHALKCSAATCRPRSTIT
jgi:hypothetical protein